MHNEKYGKKIAGWVQALSAQSQSKILYRFTIFPNTITHIIYIIFECAAVITPALETTVK